MVVPEIAHRKAVQVPPMGGIAERTEVRVMGRDDDSPAIRRQEAVELFHCPYYIGDMFNNMYRPHLTK